ncbi:transposase, partial [Vibrio cholerae HC-57A1]
MGSGGFHRQAGGAGPATSRASHPLPRRIRPECKPACAADALGARQAACGRCGASGRQRPRRAAQPRGEAPCDELGATAQAGLFHRRHRLRPLRWHRADRRQHRGTHRHPRHPRPLREARRAGRSALQARSARAASASRVTICRLHSRRRNRNPSRCGHDPQGGARP